MYEHRSMPLLPRRAFARRMAGHALFALAFIAGSLAIGVAGYHWIEGMPFIDSLLNASMLLGGMGPVGDLHTVAGKLFASAYALFAGIGFLVVAGVLFAPVIHRFLHKFHLELAADQDAPRKDLPGRQSYRADRSRLPRPATAGGAAADRSRREEAPRRGEPPRGGSRPAEGGDGQGEP
jgi:hypothetical protein